MALCAVPAFAAGASANLVGPSQIETDGSMTVGLHIDGTGITALSGKIEYDPDQLSVQHTEQKLFGTWKIHVQVSEGMVLFTAEDTQGASAIDTDTEILAVSFLVHNASPGEAIDVRAVEITGTDADGAFDAPSAVYHKTVAQNKGSDATIASITVQGGTFAPPFSPQVTSYEVTLPAGTERVDVQASPTDAKAKVSGTGNIGLVQGQSRSVALTCTAEDGTQKTYTLKLVRQSDPHAGMVTASPNLTPAPTDALQGEGMQGGTVLLLVLLGVLALGAGGWIAYTVMRKKAQEARREQRLRQGAPRREMTPRRAAYAPDPDDAHGYDRPRQARSDGRDYEADRVTRGAAARAGERPQTMPRQAYAPPAAPETTDWYDDAWNRADAYAPEDAWEEGRPVAPPRKHSDEGLSDAQADGTRVYTPHQSAHTTQRPRRMTRERRPDDRYDD